MRQIAVMEYPDPNIIADFKDFVDKYFDRNDSFIKEYILSNTGEYTIRTFLEGINDSSKRKLY